MTVTAVSESRPTAGKFTAYGAAQVVPGLVGLVSVPLWVRLFGTSAYGTYAVAWAVSISAVAFGTGWLRQAALRRSTGPRPTETAPSWAVATSVAVSAVAAAAIATPFLGAGAALPVLAFCAALGAAVLVGTALQRREQASRFMVLESSRAGLAVGAVLLLHALGVSGTTSLLMGTAIGNAVALAFVPALRSSTTVATSGASVLRQWWSYGWPMSIWLALAPVLLYTDRVVLSVVLGGHALGTYAAASDLLVRGTSLLGLTVTMALHPTVMRLVNEDRERDAYDLLRVWRARGAWAVLVLGLAALAVGPLVVRTVVGGSPPRTVLVALTMAGAVWQLAALLHKPLEIEARTRTMLAALAVAVVGQLALMAAVAPRWGQTGVAVALLVGVVAYAVTTLLQGRPIEKAAWSRS